MTVLPTLLAFVLPALWPQELADRLVFAEAADGAVWGQPVLRTKGIEKDDPTFDLSKPLTVSVWFRYPKAEGPQKSVYILGVNGGRLPSTGKFPLTNLQASVVPIGFKKKGFAGYYQSFHLPDNVDAHRFVTTDFARDYPPDEWHHAAMVSLPVKTEYYLDGRCVGSTVHAPAISPEWHVDKLRIGSPGVALGEVCVFDMALSKAIIENYHADVRSYLTSRGGTAWREK